MLSQNKDPLPFFQIEFPLAQNLNGTDRSAFIDALDKMLDEAFVTTQQTSSTELGKKFKAYKPIQQPIEAIFADPTQFTMRGYEWNSDGLVLTVKPKAGVIAQLLKGHVSNLVEKSNQSLSGRIVGWVIRTLTPGAEEEVNVEFEEETLQNCVECASHALMQVFSENILNARTRRLNLSKQEHPPTKMKM